jgi:hypothetical protein
MEAFSVVIMKRFRSNWFKNTKGRHVTYNTKQSVLVKEIPPYFKNQSVPIVSYSNTNSIGRKIFNYKEALQDINIEEYLKNPLTCDCSEKSPFGDSHVE